MFTSGYLPPRVIQWVGIFLLFVFTVVWILTDKQSLPLIGTAGSLVLLGGYERAKESMLDMVRQQRPPENGP